jgi:hypothetical protein
MEGGGLTGSGQHALCVARSLNVLVADETGGSGLV